MLLESTVDQQEPPQKVHARGKQNMFEDNPNLNNTNLENNIFIICDSFQHFSKHSLTQITPFTFLNRFAPPIAALLENTVDQQEPPQKVPALSVMPESQARPQVK